MTVTSAAQSVSRDYHEGHRMPSPFLPELRARADLSQAELAEEIGRDARQVSRYENGGVAPVIDAITTKARLRLITGGAS